MVAQSHCNFFSPLLKYKPTLTGIWTGDPPSTRCLLYHLSNLAHINVLVSTLFVYLLKTYVCFVFSLFQVSRQSLIFSCLSICLFFWMYYKTFPNVQVYMFHSYLAQALSFNFIFWILKAATCPKCAPMFSLRGIPFLMCNIWVDPHNLLLKSCIIVIKILCVWQAQDGWSE